jgi:hypothetical protein
MRLVVWICGGHIHGILVLEPCDYRLLGSDYGALDEIQSHNPMESGGGRTLHLRSLVTPDRYARCQGVPQCLLTTDSQC